MAQHRRQINKKQVAILAGIAVAVIIALLVATFNILNEPASVETRAEPTVEVMPPLIADEAELDYDEVTVKSEPSPPPVPTVEAKPTPTTAPQPIVEAPVAPVAPEIPRAVQPPTDPNMARVNEIMAKYNAYAHPMTEFVFGPLPAACVEKGADACVITQFRQYTYADGTTKRETVRIVMHLQPHLLPDFLVVHEIAHTHGIFGECEADQWAYAKTGFPPGVGHYC